MAAEKSASKPPVEYELYIMRHGIAAPREGAGYPDDAKRPLTAEGKKKMQDIARGLMKLGVELDWIVSSPYVRAAETARQVAETFNGVPLDTADALKPGGSPEALISYLARHANRQRVLVVGHEPDLSDMAGRLIGAGRRSHLGFKKGGCCLITFEDFPPKGPGRLVWWLTPRILRKLA